MFGQQQTPQQTTGLFGAASATNQTNGLFGATAASAPAAAPNNTGNSLFSTTPAPTAGGLFGGSAAKPSGLFGSNTTTNSSAPLFSTNNASAATTTNTSTAPATNSLFGTSSLSGFGKPTTSLFGTPAAPTANTGLNAAQPQQQQQQQQQQLLNTQNCFPDTQIPHFIVTQDGLTRSTVPADSFLGNTARDDALAAASNSSSMSLSTSFVVNEKNKTLPSYLTSFDTSNSSTNTNKSSTSKFPAKKRVLEAEEGQNKPDGRNVIPKTSEQGVFAQSSRLTEGFDMNLKKNFIADALPGSSIDDVGVSYSTYRPNDTVNKFNHTNTSMNGLVNTNISANASGSMSSLNKRVRVFGFDPQQAEKIVEYFTKLGDLFEPYTSQGNWITFHYVSHESALKAIKLNGTKIDQDHLVGVAWDESAKEIETLKSQSLGDLYKKEPGLFIDNRNQQSTHESKEGLMNRLREIFMTW